jgi:hypothetical protein
MKKRPKIATVRILPACADSCAGGGLANRLALAGGSTIATTRFFLLTHTDGEQPVGVFTAVVLLAALLWVLKPGKAHRWKCALLIMAPIALGQVAVSVLKRVVQEPRPYDVAEP